MDTNSYRNYYDWLAPKLSSEERKALDVIYEAANSSSGPSRKGSDTARLDLIENTQTYPWRDFGCWKFRSGKKFYQGDTVRAVLDAALHDLPTATKEQG